MGEQGAIVIPPGGGKVLLDGRWWLKAGGDTTLGALSVLEMDAPPGTQPPQPHFHEDSEEMWYVLDGLMRFGVAGDVFDAPKGTFVVVPRGVIHSLWNPDSQQTSRYLLLLTPSGMEGYFEELGSLIGSDAAGIEARRVVSAKYKVIYPGPPATR